MRVNIQICLKVVRTYISEIFRYKIINVLTKIYKRANDISLCWMNLINYGLEWKKILLLESDCKLKDNFINIINSEIAILESKFWILGSIYYGESSWVSGEEISIIEEFERRNHINGVAVYNRTNEFMNLVNKLFVDNDLIEDKGNYDWILSKNIHYNFGKKALELLRDSKYIINLSHPEDKYIDADKIKSDWLICHQK